MNEPAVYLDSALAEWLAGLSMKSAARPSMSAAERLRGRWSWRLSLLLHAAVLAFGLAAVLADMPFSANPASAARVGLAAADEYDVSPPLLLTIDAGDVRTSAVKLAEDEISRLAASVPPPDLAVELLDPAAAPSNVATAWLERRVWDEVASAEKLSLEDQRRKLAALGGQLEQISSAESVDAISRKLGGLFGSASRATQPTAEPVPGEFDYDTAQLHDVKRTENDSGGYDYVAVLLDAAGRTTETLLSEAEGEQLYKTFQLIKSNPLLERVYRGVVMSLFDKLMRQQPKQDRND